MNMKQASLQHQATWQNSVSRSCWQLLLVSTLLLLIFPSHFTQSLWFGQTWFWLIATPGSMLLVIHRHRLAAACSTALVRSRARRRWQSSSQQARRKGFGKLGAYRNPLRAA